MKTTHKRHRFGRTALTEGGYITLMKTTNQSRDHKGAVAGRTSPFLLAAIFLTAAVIAQQRHQDIDLQAAMRTATVDGDLSKAIKQYAAIVAKYKNDREVTAMALVHMAEAYQKMLDGIS